MGGRDGHGGNDDLDEDAAMIEIDQSEAMRRFPNLCGRGLCVDCVHFIVYGEVGLWDKDRNVVMGFCKIQLARLGLFRSNTLQPSDKALQRFEGDGIVSWPMVLMSWFCNRHQAVPGEESNEQNG